MKLFKVSDNAAPRPVRLLSLAIAALMVLAVEAVWAEPAPGASQLPLTVYKTPNCGCCTLWAEHMQENGFEVNEVLVEETQSLRSQLGIPNQLASCHTAVAGDYWVEGHVPADLVSRLLAEQPDDIEGISAPGMPLGSPGMEAPNASTYQVVSLDDEGNIEVYAIREGEQSR